MAVTKEGEASEWFLMAEAYDQSSRILFKGFHGRTPAYFEYVIAANFAFGLELYLKCLIVLDGQRPKLHHNLRTHFLSIPQPAQTAIEKRYRKILHRSNLDKAVRGIESRQDKSRNTAQVLACS